MKTSKSLRFTQLFIPLIFFILSALPTLLSAQVSGEITAVKDSDGQNLGDANPEVGETYTVEFTGQNIRDLHVKLPNTIDSVCYHSGSIPDTPADGCDIDVSFGDFDDGKTFNAVLNDDPNLFLSGPYISLYLNEDSESLSGGSFQIRVNNGTPGVSTDIVVTSDGDADPFNGVVGEDWDLVMDIDNAPGIPISVSSEVIPTLSEWGVIILILLTLAVGMVFLYRRETALASAGNIQAVTSASKPELFDKRLYAKVFGVVLLIGMSILGMSYLYFGEITSADPFGTFVSSAIVAYMVHLLILKKARAE